MVTIQRDVLSATFVANWPILINKDPVCTANSVPSMYAHYAAMMMYSSDCDILIYKRMILTLERAPSLRIDKGDYYQDEFDVNIINN
jgi:hypothetical protein